MLVDFPKKLGSHRKGQLVKENITLSIGLCKACSYTKEMHRVIHCFMLSPNVVDDEKCIKIMGLSLNKVLILEIFLHNFLSEEKQIKDENLVTSFKMIYF